MLIEIWSDVVCPWCAIGKARFDKALDTFEHRDDVEVVLRSFELDPNAPPVRTGTPAEHIARKYGIALEEAQQANDHLVEVAALDGLAFDFTRTRPGNTFDAHRLLHLAHERGCQAALSDALMQGYFGNGLAVGDPGELAQVATGVGLGQTDVDAVLAGDAYGEAVRADETRARELNITGVPFFLIDGRFAVPGAQPVERFTMGLDRAWDKITAS